MNNIESIENEILNDLIANSVGNNSGIKDIVKLHGDASYRAYYRVYLNDGKTLILMKMPIGRSSASEEITNFNGTHKELPFINVEKFLRKRDVHVPNIYHYSEEHHLMILEDLGDGLMAKKVESAGDEIRKEWYKKAIDVLVDLQEKTINTNKADCVAQQRSFDQTLLNWEFDHFLEYGIGARLNLQMSKEDLEIFEQETRNISNTIAKFPYGFTHRDFQSRNILISNDKLYLIDFQDALLGPVAYDLVSLLRDSYIKLPNTLLTNLINYYCEKTSRDISSFQYEFDIITCQRKLKDAGRFVYIDKVKKNSNFLKYIPTSLQYVREAFERLTKHHTLYEVLRKYVPEWGKE